MSEDIEKYDQHIREWIIALNARYQEGLKNPYYGLPEWKQEYLRDYFDQHHKDKFYD